MIKQVTTFILAIGLALWPVAALAQSSGLNIRNGTSSLTSPVANQTWNFDEANLNIEAWNGTAWMTRTLPQANLLGGGAPTADDDNTQGYAVGSQWFDTSSQEFYMCTSAATSAAVWQQFTGAVLPSGGALYLTESDWLSDFVVSGLLGSVPSSSLTMTTPSGIAYVSGTRVTWAGGSYLYTASKDTYDYLQAGGGTINHIAVANNASAPTGQAGLFIQKVVSGASITAVTQTQAVTPVATLRSPLLQFTGSGTLPVGGYIEYSLTPITPTNPVTIQIPDPGITTVNLAYMPSTGGYTAGGIAYGNGNTLQVTAAGTSGKAVISGGASTPTIGTLQAVGGGTGNAVVPSTGSMLVGNAAGTAYANVGVGTNGYLWTADSSQTNGAAYEAPVNVINSGTSGQVAGYTSTGTAINGLPNLTFVAGAITLGQATGPVAGSLKLYGSTSGTNTISTPAAAGTGSATTLVSGASNTVLPLSSGTSHQWVSYINSSGTQNLTQPAYSDISGAPTINSGTSGELAYYSASSATISSAADAAISAGALSLGLNAATVPGSIVFYGSTSGSVTLGTHAAAGTSTVFNLPATNGTSTYLLQTDGSGNTSWVSPPSSGGGLGGSGSDGAVALNTAQALQINATSVTLANAAASTVHSGTTINSTSTITIGGGSSGTLTADQDVAGGGAAGSTYGQSGAGPAPGTNSGLEPVMGQQGGGGGGGIGAGGAGGGAANNAVSGGVALTPGQVPTGSGGGSGASNSSGAGGAGGNGGAGFKLIANGNISIAAGAEIILDGAAGGSVSAAQLSGGGGGSAGTLEAISVTGSVVNSGTIHGVGGAGGNGTGTNGCGGGGGAGANVILWGGNGTTTAGTCTLTGGAGGTSSPNVGSAGSTTTALAISSGTPSLPLIVWVEDHIIEIHTIPAIRNGVLCLKKSDISGLAANGDFQKYAMLQGSYGMDATCAVPLQGIGCYIEDNNHV